jgi:hypothetical protein
MSTTLSHPDLEKFKQRIGYPGATDATPDRVLAVEWPGLLPAAQAELSGLVLELEEAATVMTAAVPERSWMLRGAPGKVVISVKVAPTSAEARDLLLAEASGTMMRQIPYERGPDGLGDLSAQSTAGNAQAVMWAYRNIFVRLDNDASGFEVIDAAHAIQRFLGRHQTVSAAQAAPRIEALRVSAERIRVGDRLEATVVLGDSGPSREALTSIGEVAMPRRLEQVSVTPLRAEWRAATPGRTEIGVRAMHPGTLLSTTRRATVEITLPPENER